MSPRPALTAKDGQVLDLLVQVCRIVERRGLGNRHDVARICHHVLPQAVDPRIPELTQRARDAERRADNAERRAHAAETDNQRLRARIAATHANPSADSAEVFTLAPRAAAVINAAGQGIPRDRISTELGITMHNVSCVLSRVAQQIGATGPEQAIALVAGGRVKVQAKGRAA